MLLLAMAFGAGIAIACGDDQGTTTKCSELELYDIRAEDDTAAEQHRQMRLQLQQDEGCITGPGTASTVAPDAGSTD
jgi:hypothetical protein